MGKNSGGRMKTKKYKVPKVESDEMLIVKVGSEERPAYAEDIQNMIELFDTVNLKLSCLFYELQFSLVFS
jgi:hypothetical protein